VVNSGGARKVGTREGVEVRGCSAWKGKKTLSARAGHRGKAKHLGGDGSNKKHRAGVREGENEYLVGYLIKANINKAVRGDITIQSKGERGGELHGDFLLISRRDDCDVSSITVQRIYRKGRQHSGLKGPQVAKRHRALVNKKSTRW